MLLHLLVEGSFQVTVQYFLLTDVLFTVDSRFFNKGRSTHTATIIAVAEPSGREQWSQSIFLTSLPSL